MITWTEKSFLQPTLSLYLGGSGIAVGEDLLRIVESMPPDDRATIEPFFIDAQEPAIVDHARARHYSYSNLYEFYDPVYREFSDVRFPEYLGVTPVINSSEGCGVTRIFGAASLVNCRDDFARLIDEAIARLRARRRTDAQPMQVFLTASSCGGTGAGMIIDAAAMIRHFFRLRNESPRIFMFLIGPNVYFEDATIPLREDQRDRMRASSYALLKELNHFSRGKEFKSAYRLRDQDIVISNVRDDDRLFEWVYYIDGRSEGGTTRSFAEVSWTIAEAQVHLCTTEVGRKVGESLPNQREERTREFAIHFVHPDNKDRLTDELRERLETASRRTFLASLAVRNVRFPVEAIKQWFRTGWVHGGLQKLLQRTEPRVEQFDRLLGYDGSSIQPDGLLADLGLTREQLLGRIHEAADAAKDIPSEVPVNASPERIIGAVGELLDAADALVEELETDSSLVEHTRSSGRLSSTAQLCQKALPHWQTLWLDGLSPEGDIAARLWELACHPVGGHGLRWLEVFVSHTTSVLTELAREARRHGGNLAELEERLSILHDRLNGFQRSHQRDRGSVFTSLWRKAMAKLADRSVHSPNLLQKGRGLAKEVNALRAELIEQRQARIAHALAPSAWLVAAEALKKWRDEVLSPTITAADNARTLAQNQWKLARQALARNEGENGRGFWRAHTTVQIADDELLRDLSAEIETVEEEDLVLAPLYGDGMAHERHRLTLKSLRTMDRELVVKILDAHVTEVTRGRLTFLDNAWMLDTVAARLRTTVARVLDDGAEPLTSFSRASVGQQTQSYLLKPRDLILPQPFGRRLGRMNPLVSTDSLQIGVVTFVFGIPPNTLADIRDMFEQYSLHVGDQLRNKAQDRYPMHVFRGAQEVFAEPYSPLDYHTDDTGVQALVRAARALWGNNGGVKLEIRRFDESTIGNDWDQYVELTEKVMRALLRRPQLADALLVQPGFELLRRIYANRRYRVVMETPPPPSPDPQP